jgi:hypothetical protein
MGSSMVPQHSGLAAAGRITITSVPQVAQRNRDPGRMDGEVDGDDCMQHSITSWCQ